MNEITKTPYKFIYSSFPNRGLLQLLQMWPRIIDRYPSASLHIYSDIDGSWVNSVEKEKMCQIREILDRYKRDMNGLNISYHGWVGKTVLADAWKTSEYWFYPCTFMETFCLTALEAALSRTLCITNGLAALQNTVGDRGICIPGDSTTDEWQQKALIELFDVMENNRKREELVEKNYAWASGMSWENRANKLLSEHITQPRNIKDSEKDSIFDLKGMKNWTHDLPVNTNARQTFEKVLRLISSNKSIKQPKVLEVGTYTGTSLIEIVKQLQNSTGVGVDRWTDYTETNGETIVDILRNIESNHVEEAFHNNVIKAGLEKRIKGVKGDSSKILMEMVKNRQWFDFIYVDGSHVCIDVALDLFLSWNLLRCGGIIAIDDYLYGSYKANPIEYPYEAVNHFINTYKNDIRILDKGYRVFLQKIN